jgi:hypothetical protein
VAGRWSNLEPFFLVITAENIDYSRAMQKTILIADDDPHIREVIQFAPHFLLQKRGRLLLSALFLLNLQQALAIFKRKMSRKDL